MILDRRAFLKTGLTVLTTSVLSYGFVRSCFSKSKKMIAMALPRVGMNLGGISYYSSEWPLNDLFKHAAEIGADQGVTLDDKGEVITIPTGKKARRIIYAMPDDVSVDLYIKNIRYALLYDGDEAVYASNAKTNRNTLFFEEHVKLVSQTPQKIIFEIKANHSLTLSIASLHPQNPIKNIRILPLATKDSEQKGIWSPRFLALLDGFSCIRFMDMMKTNNSTQSAWENRPKEEDAVYSTDKGCPLALMVNLANEKQINPWFCIPHMADDDYVVQFATYLRDHLDHRLKAYIEYSNETWNGGFQQYSYAKNQALALGVGEEGNQYVAYRSIQIFDIFGKVYGEALSKRVVRVLASQASWAEVAKKRLSFKQAYQKVDVLAIAPYISLMVGPEMEAKVASWSLDQLFDYIKQVALPESMQWMASNKAIADEYGVQLVAYEGGQHMVGVAGVENNQKITDLLIAANQDHRLEQIYRDYLDVWAKTGGDLFCHYNFIGGWSKWGSWSLLQSKYEPLTNASKWQGIAKWANTNGQKVLLK
jgi:hypothetical protein